MWQSGALRLSRNKWCLTSRLGLELNDACVVDSQLWSFLLTQTLGGRDTDSNHWNHTTHLGDVDYPCVATGVSEELAGTIPLCPSVFQVNKYLIWSRLGGWKGRGVHKEVKEADLTKANDPGWVSSGNATDQRSNLGHTKGLWYYRKAKMEELSNEVSACLF